MSRLLRRSRGRIAVALLFLNLSGARAVCVSDPCESSRVFFTPALGFKAITKTVLRQNWRKAASNPASSLGERSPRYSALDLETLRSARRIVLVASLPPVSTALPQRGGPSPSLSAWKLPSDRSPVQPTHLHTKK